MSLLEVTGELLTRGNENRFSIKIIFPMEKNTKEAIEIVYLAFDSYHRMSLVVVVVMDVPY